ncbi:hypothetical protein N9L23_06385 [Alphaproteobacteria bacterium]|nr:hypothetical protein [Alphaproteobacteria bacterium]
MQRFTYDLLHDVTEDTEIIQSSEIVRSMQLPAYATDAQRKELFLEIMDALDDVSFTAQRLRLDVGKDFITLRRELGGGWSDEEHGDAFESPVPMTGVMNDLNNAIDAELEDIRNKLEKDKSEITTNEKDNAQ